ncbi:MAG: hypothetical protein IRY85_02460 [Micromonosporaceae bacterium]|nr:hypothetical protein [Micromonosporaceae bacterium]
MNRALWTVIGLVLLVAGVFGLLVGYGVLSFVDRQQVVLPSSVIDFWNRNEAWLLALTILAGLVVAVLGVRLIRAQLRRRGGAPMADLYLPSPPEPTEAPQAEGGTEVASRALHRALQRDLESDRQIRDATVRLTGPADHPRLRVRLAVTADADVAALADHVDRAMHRFTTTSGLQPDLSEVVVRIPTRAPAHVE